MEWNINKGSLEQIGIWFCSIDLGPGTLSGRRVPKVSSGHSRKWEGGCQSWIEAMTKRNAKLIRIRYVLLISLLGPPNLGLRSTTRGIHRIFTVLTLISEIRLSEISDSSIMRGECVAPTSQPPTQANSRANLARSRRAHHSTAPALKINVQFGVK